MLYNGVDIFRCTIFTVDKDSGKLKFYSGSYKGKIADDFNTIEDIKKITAYCFWILTNKTMPLVSKYAASAFLRELSPKTAELELKIRNHTIDEQNRLKKETEESAKKIGTKYI